MAPGYYISHRKAVSGWLAQAGKGLSNEQLVDLLEQALRALCSVARPNISETMLAAVLDRALVHAAEAHPSLPQVTVQPGAADFSALRAAAPRLTREMLLEAVEFVVADFLAILGNLTADILNKKLHSKLAGLRLKRGRGAD